MDLVTSSVFSPGKGGTTAWLDQVLLLPRHGLLAIADAPSGGADGRAGIRIALETVRTHVERNEDILQRFVRTPAPELRKRILAVVDEAYARAAQEIFAFARRRQGIVITLDVLLLLEHEAFIGHVGDGRVYLVRRGLVHQLTVDHSRGDEGAVFERGQEVEQATAGDRKFTRALGPHPRVRVETLCMELTHGDRFIVASSHLHRSIPENILNTRLVSEHLDGLGPALVSDAGSSPLVAACAQLGSGEPFTPDSAQSRLAILAPMPMFAHCNERELRTVAQATRPRRFPEGTIIFEQGHPGTELYLLISGSVDIIKDGQRIVRLGPGSNFGEMAMLDEPSRSASAMAAAETELMVIPRDAFFAMLKGNPMLAVKILWNMLLRLSANLRATSKRLADLERGL
ncbi:MAG: cyclic nucleotide-binding domain-containing protein [Alphaproteobacteria bacterium]|nr:cyclic nucleotide-binding domain-containing protein [Alphaproteobacteria bacterium]MCB9691441.1 cyclic nucleotide-binding domain-containing protein [Alphaproteobacteria bacterium]